MKRVEPQPDWPASWRLSYNYDLPEIYGNLSNIGYAHAYANRRKHTLALIQKVARPGASILDVAAAQGNFSLTLAELGYNVVWNDIRSELADYVRLKYENGAIKYAPGNIFSMASPPYFDVVLISEIIEHTAHPDEFLRRIGMLTKPGGHVVMTTPNGGYLMNHLPKFSDCSDPSQFEGVQFGPNSGDHIFLLHLDEIDSLAKKAGLRVLEIRLLSNPLTNGHLKLRAALKLAPGTLVDKIELLTQRLPLNILRKTHTTMAVLFARAT